MENIEKILEELYNLDPSLKKNESELKKFLAEFIAARPEVKIDKEFAAGLRQKLLAQASLMKDSNINKNSIFMKKFSFAFTGMLVIAVAILAGNQYMKNRQQVTESLLSGKLEVSPLNGQAFGNLSSYEINDASISARPQSGGGSGNSVSSVAPITENAEGRMSEKMIYPPLGQNIKYTYVGENLELKDTELDVLKRVKGFTSAAAKNILKQLNVGLLNISRLVNPQLDQVTISEDRDMGYTFYLSMTEGTVNISQNWTRWPNPYDNCNDDACYQSLKLNISQIPDDASIISIAEKFLNDYGISRENYGAPFVQNAWRTDYEAATDKSLAYVPEEGQVIFPYVFNGQEVYDQWGNKTGLMVNVNFRAMKASGVSELNSLRFESSKYSTETDFKKLVAIAEKGGLFPNYYYIATLAGQANINVELGTPSVVYVRMYQYTQKESKDLLVPALLFPATTKDSLNNTQIKNVVVPLVKEILDDPSYTTPIMPLDTVPASEAPTILK